MTILDSIDRKPIPLAEIITTEKKSFYTDSLGMFTNDIAIVFPAKIRKIGYKDKNISQQSNNILLSPKTITIPTVTINKKNEAKFSPKIRMFNYWVFRNDYNTENGIILKGEEGKMGKLKNIAIPIKDKNVSNTTFFKINFYEIDDKDNISTTPLNTEDILINASKLESKTNIDVTKYNIVFTDKILISLQLIDRENSNQTIKLKNTNKDGNLYYQTIKGWKFYSSMSIPAISYTILY